MEILLIRHGETAWNAERRLQGHLDVPLNEHGRRQAEALAAALGGEPLDAVFASDLQRAVQTAQPLAAAHGQPVRTDASLRERCYGAFEGLLYDEIAGHFPVAHAAWQAREPDARFPAGRHVAETLREFVQRALAAVSALARSPGYRRIAVVTHGGVLEALHRSLCDGERSPVRDFEIPNAGINRLRHDGQRLHIERWAEVAHLQRLGQAALDEIDG